MLLTSCTINGLEPDLNFLRDRNRESSLRNVVDDGVDRGSERVDGDEAASQMKSIPGASPLPLPEQIIQLVIDEIRLDKERALAAVSHVDAESTSKAIDRAFRFDDDLKHLSLVSRLWTRPARCALGRRFVLILDEKRLPRLPIALESPLYGPWTTHIEMLEMPCAPLRDKNAANGIWALVRQVLGRLENAKSFTINSRILWSSGVRLPWLLPSFKNLEQVTLINTGIIVTSDSLDLYQKLANLSSELPLLRRMTYLRCLPVGDSTSDWQPLPSQGPCDFPLQLQAIKASLFSSFNCCFMASLVSIAYDREDMRWSIDEMTATHLRSICSEKCKYSDPSGVCSAIRSLRVVGDVKRLNSPCMANFLRNFDNAKVLHLSFGMLPAQEVLDAVPNTLEEAAFKIKSRPNDGDFGPFDERLSRFCHAHRSKLRRLTLSLGDIEQSSHRVSFPLTDTFCGAHNVDFPVFCETASSAT